jgi:hypothetical protein
MRSLLLLLLLFLLRSPLTAQTPMVFRDSLELRIHPAYDKPGKFHRFLFGENYRKEWSALTKLPVFRISEIEGGLTPQKRGGGMQSKSLRLVDTAGREWVIRSVEKTTDSLLPPGVRQTFVRDWLDDVTSAQHPFSAMTIPPIANAVGIPHSVPVIGVVAPDKNLGEHAEVFTNMVVLLEQREPLGKSENTADMLEGIVEDNDNTILGKELLRARILDAYIADWDRHADQWRWVDTKKGKGKAWLAVPRDRDQAFHVRQGLIPDIAAVDYVLPTLRDFDKELSNIKWVLFKTNFLNPYPGFQLSHDDWTKEVKRFQENITDSVLEESLKRLPRSAYEIRHDHLLSVLKARRERLPAAMERFYRFTQKIVDIRASDKNEFVRITGVENGGLNIHMRKISKDGELEDTLMDKTYDAALTKELRLFVEDGKDSVVINSPDSRIRLRLVGGRDRKSFTVIESKKKIRLYNLPGGSGYSDDTRRLRKHISGDSANTSFMQTNLYNIWMPLAIIGINRDDGFIVGAGVKFTKQEGFRKSPYTSNQMLLATHSSSTRAFSIRYSGEWIHALGKADIVVRALVKAPNNTINFFGRGNESDYDKDAHTITYYRTRFNTYQFTPQLRWRNNRTSYLAAGPSVYYYAFDVDDNAGRFIQNNSLIGSYDSATIEKQKLHIGVALDYVNDRRNSAIIPVTGTYMRVQLNAYKSASEYAKSFAQLIPEFAVYKSLTKSSTLVFADRIGGTISVGKTAFYQSAFLGGHENLLGYRQYRFSGQHSIYNNMELRLKVADIASYILPGQFGLSAFWDIGRVWEEHDDSGEWHNGVGGGVFFAPGSLVSFSFVVGKSSEGWYPYFTMGFRF